MILPRQRRTGTVLAAAVAVLTACQSAPGPSGPSPSPSGQAAASSPSRVAGWDRDLDGLLPAMEALHPDLYHSTPKATLEADLEALKATVPGANDDHVMVGLLRLVAEVSAKGRDGHTGAFIWGGGTYPLHSLPLRLWSFADGLFVVDALNPYRDLVGSRVESIAGRPTAEVLGALDPLIPRDNPETVILLAPRFLLIPEVLHGLGLIPSVGPVSFGLVGETGSRRTVEVDPVPMSDYNHWAGAYGLHLPTVPNVLYLSRPEEPLWFTMLDDGSGTLYVQYNRVDYLPSALLDDLHRVARRTDVERIVVDIRHNYGGETHAYPDVLDVFVSADVHPPLGLFVITGRNTFSAASLFAAEMDRRTGAVFVGEPMGGSPNLYGNSRDVRLPYSGLAVSVATEYEEPGGRPDPRLEIEPDRPVRLTSAAYFAGRDPAIEAILASGG